MKNRILILLSMVFCSICASTLAQEAVVKVDGAVGKPFSITSASFRELNQVKVTVRANDGREHEYSGISLHDILTKAEAVPNHQLRGKALSKFMLVSAADGYQVVIALPETDPDFTDQTIILANKMDGEELPPNFGPYRLVVPQDKRPARSAMRVTRIEVLDARNKEINDY